MDQVRRGGALPPLLLRAIGRHQAAPRRCLPPVFEWNVPDQQVALYLCGSGLRRWLVIESAVRIPARDASEFLRQIHVLDLSPDL